MKIFFLSTFKKEKGKNKDSKVKKYIYELLQKQNSETEKFCITHKWVRQISLPKDTGGFPVKLFEESVLNNKTPQTTQQRDGKIVKMIPDE